MRCGHHHCLAVSSPPTCAQYYNLNDLNNTTQFEGHNLTLSLSFLTVHTLTALKPVHNHLCSIIMSSLKVVISPSHCLFLTAAALTVLKSVHNHICSIIMSSLKVVISPSHCLFLTAADSAHPDRLEVSSQPQAQL